MDGYDSELSCVEGGTYVCDDAEEIAFWDGILTLVDPDWKKKREK